MFFSKSEKKKHHPFLMLGVGMLAATGAIAITCKGKKCIKNAVKSTVGLVKKMCKSGECTSCSESTN